MPCAVTDDCQKPAFINHWRLQRNISSRYAVWFERSYPGREGQNCWTKQLVATRFTMAVIDCTPADLHNGKTLEERLNGRKFIKTDGKHTNGNVALIKSAEDENEHDGQEGLVHTSSVIITPGEIQVYILAIVCATVVPPRNPIGAGQPSAPLGFVEEQAVSEER